MGSEPEPSTTIVEDATCTFCGCLCDDIALSVDGDRITEAGNACALGKHGSSVNASSKGRLV